MAKDLVKTLADLKEKEALKIVEDRLRGGEDPLKILDDARRAVEIVGKRFADGEYFIPELIYSGEILKAISGRVKPKITPILTFPAIASATLNQSIMEVATALIISIPVPKEAKRRPAWMFARRFWIFTCPKPS